MKRNWLGLLLVFVVEATNARKCYVCGPTADEPFNRIRSDGTAKLHNITLSCEEFENAQQPDEMEKFARECPHQYVGCTTQVDGATVIRTCDRLAVNDCKRANGIDYCYCNHDLCNSRKAEFIREEQQKEQQSKSVEHTHKRHKLPPSDDEDSMDGSGQEMEPKRQGKGKHHQPVDENDSEEEDDPVDTDAVVGATEQPSNSVLAVEYNLIVLLISYVIAYLRNY